MKKNRVFLWGIVLFLGILMLPVMTVSAKDKVVFGSDYVLESGDKLNGNLVVFGGDVTIEEEALVDGDIAIFGGNIDIDGEVSGDIAAFGGNISLGPNSIIDGNFSAMGGTVNKSPTAIIKGDTLRQDRDILLDTDNSGKPLARGNKGRTGFWLTFFGVLGSIGLFFAMVLIIAGLGLLTNVLLGSHLEGIGKIIVEKPWNAFGIGLVTVIAAPFVFILFCMTVILIPLAFLLILALILLIFYGWIACGYEAGQWMTKSMKVTWTSNWTTAFGTFVITLVAHGLKKIIPCVGWMPGGIAALFGLGGVMIYYYHRYQDRPKKSTSNPQLPENNPPSGDYRPRENTIPQSSSEEEKMRQSREEPVAEKSEKGPTDSQKPESVIELPGKVETGETEEGSAQNGTEEMRGVEPVLEFGASEPQKETDESSTNVETPPKKKKRGVGASVLDSIHESEMRDHSTSEDHPETSNETDKDDSEES